MRKVKFSKNENGEQRDTPQNVDSSIPFLSNASVVIAMLLLLVLYVQ